MEMTDPGTERRRMSVKTRATCPTNSTRPCLWISSMFMAYMVLERIPGAMLVNWTQKYPVLNNVSAEDASWRFNPLFRGERRDCPALKRAALQLKSIIKYIQVWLICMLWEGTHCLNPMRMFWEATADFSEERNLFLKNRHLGEK